MGRQILAVTIGVLLSFLTSGMCATLLYQHPIIWSLPGPTIARFIFNPLIALFVGAIVGILAKSRPGTIAALALAPWAIGFIFFRRQDMAHLFQLLALVLLYIFAGIAGAVGAVRIRGGHAPAA